MKCICSGLDSVTSTQCISLLKELAQDGRTIICTIHQPSALIFEMFDHLFAIAEGTHTYLISFILFVSQILIYTNYIFRTVYLCWWYTKFSSIFVRNRFKMPRIT